ncbi:pseudaminic acid cytidylyltransferase [Agarivorans litoreus]|uniref:pseudaminic acid cytidylyltransferase n=1 Tax=Agarivorans litoreus TaxID=1510455 RepID=UPI001C7CCEA6|nr:pseudaminic acid cytidylyltransferase [Agarivorans litoreus]
MKVAIIPARGGSKRIPRKNIKLFHGKPIIAYSIEAALASGCFDKVIISTDDSEIAEVAIEYGAEVPFIRPANIANDFATTGDVLKHAISWFNHPIDYVCCIYATAPFIQPSQIQLAYQLISSNENANYCFPVCEFPFPIQRAIKLTSDNRAEMFQPENFNCRSQDLEPAYQDVGQFYWGLPNAFLGDIPMFSKSAITFKLPRKFVVDLDTPDDWELASLLYQAQINASKPRKN